MDSPPAPLPAQPELAPAAPVEADNPATTEAEGAEGEPGGETGLGEAPCPECPSGGGWGDGLGDGVGTGGGQGDGAGDGSGDGTGTGRGGDDVLYLDGTITPPALLDRVLPVYPEVARRARVEGAVILQVVVERDGSITQIEVVRSQPLFDQAAIDAVSRWRYKPAALGDRPVRVSLTIRIEFRLN
jgi:TonB family protein